MPYVDDVVSPVPGRPVSVSIAFVLTWAEALGLVAFVVSFSVDVFPVGDPVLPRLAMALGVIIFLLVVVAGLVAAARALSQLRHWPRSLLIVLQVIALAIGVPFARDGVLVGWLMSLVALASIGALLAPATTAAIEA